MELSKQITTLIICLAVLIGSLFITNQSALADLKQGTVQRGRFNSTKIVLDRTFREEGGYIREKDLHRTTPLNRKVNVYDGHERKIGYAQKNTRTGGINTYDNNGKKTGHYRKVFNSPNY